MKILLMAVTIILLAGIMVSTGCAQSAPSEQQDQQCTDNACPEEPQPQPESQTQTSTEQRSSPSALVPRVIADELLQKIQQNDDMLIIDDRRGVETSFAESHIKGAVSVPFDLILSHDWTPPENKDLEIIIYCS